MTGLNAATARAWVVRFLDAAESEAGALGELDRLAGDGDFGTSVTTAVRGTWRELGDGPLDRPGAAFAALSTAYLGTGGTSGPLYGMFFRALAKAAGDAPELDLATLADGVGAGVAAVRRLGGAEVGERTMVDALQPAADALAAGGTLTGALDAAALAARAGADATAGLVARRGRATYVGDAATGVVDPGAALVALFFEAAADR
ncbi:DAK2 domain-containing protein [Solirubrobacter ginsenosidimutans]|uniref:DAK2 domain-containing protein n=1 Tax=Solirubrobacter ginsenosidimutans TaxID=490573 RepID=A0A9X3MYS5_9ACTN|nr:DAK2 domain-containing protein [Solirubrobacter ginsenosidimutans]MDA0165324.1 DAK2 domain-containing protein [Solirubrobacter ginsenosidimutans]